MLKKESNQLVAITNISESLTTQRVTRQQSAQTEASVSKNIPLGSTHVTTTVSKSDVRYTKKKGRKPRNFTILIHNFVTQ